jgi:aminoglycoside phosphotransferase (APT) family kinase protein
MSGPLAIGRALWWDGRGRLWHRRERRWAGAVAPLLVAAVTGVSGPPWRTESVVFTSTSVAVVTVIRRGSRRRFVVKVPWSADGVTALRRQAGVLTVLHRDARLHRLRPLLPHCVWQGAFEGRYFCVEEALPGVPAGAVMLRDGGAGTLLRAAAGVIGDLHALTAESTVLDAPAVTAWVDAPLDRLAAYAAARPRADRLAAALRRLRAELLAALVGRRVRTGWIHGDFWPGNLLAAPPDTVTGVVDWDRAAARQLPLHDLLHLYVFARRLASGEELGDIVTHALRGGIGAAVAVPGADSAAWLDGIPPRAAVLLYWLRHMRLFIDAEGDHDRSRWRRGNVERVLINV